MADKEPSRDASTGKADEKQNKTDEKQNKTDQKQDRALAKEIDGGMTEKELDALLSRESKEYDKVRINHLP